MKFKYNDGGRKLAGFKGGASDCGCRALAIATGLTYKDAYELINKYGKAERITKRKKTKSSARTGIWVETYKKIMVI